MHSVHTRIHALVITFAMAMLMILGVWWVIPAAHADTDYEILCPADGNGSEAALTAAIEQANANAGLDEIVISSTGKFCVFTLDSTFADNGNGGVGLPLITDDLVIRAHGVSATLERDPGSEDIFRLLESEADLTLENVTVRNGRTPYPRRGGGILAHQALTLTNVVLTGNLGNGGGGAYVAGRLRLDRVTLNNNGTNTADPSHGGGIWTEGDLTATYITATGNTASDCGCGGDEADGGGLYVGGNAIISSATISQNESTGPWGGGLYVGGDLTLSDSTFYSNTASFAGGGLAVMGALSLSGTTFDHNRANLGGGVYAESEGPAITIVDSKFEYNVSGLGGGLYSPRQVSVDGSRFVGNTAESVGGGAYIDEGTVENSRFEANTAAGTPESYGGGALFVYYDSTIRNNHFVSNTAPAGGGAFIAQVPPLSNVSLVLNNLWLDNDADEGAAVFVGISGDDQPGAHAEINHNTIVRQTQSDGSAVLIADGTANVYNNIITQHTIGVSGGAEANVISDYNLFYQNVIRHAGVPAGPNNLEGNPLFVDVANADYRLQADSPAVDSGLDLGVSEDIDGVSRPQGDGFDRGAYETVETSYAVYLPTVVK